MKTYAYEVPLCSLAEFLNKANGGDSSGGNTVKIIEKLVDKMFLVVITRQDSYSYITEALKEVPGVLAPGMR